MPDLKKILTTAIIVVGVLAVVNRVAQLRHFVKGETTMVNGRVVRDPRDEYISR